MKRLLILIIIGSFISIGGAVIGQNRADIGNAIKMNDIAVVDNPSISQLETTKRANDRAQPIIDIIGKKDKSLSDKVSNSAPNQKLRVAIWVKADGIANIKKSDVESDIISQLDQNKRANIAKVGADVFAKQKSLTDYLNSKNITILYKSKYAPVLFAELTKADIQDIGNRVDTELMQLETQYQDAISNSVPSVLAPPVWPYYSGGVVVAVVEDDGIAFANPYLKSGKYFNPKNPKVYYHATGIAGIIGSMNQTYRGVAYNAPALLSANSQTLSDSDLMNATEWAMDNGASILSNSWVLNTGGGWTPMTSYYDYIVSHFPWPTVIFSAGNCGECGNPLRVVGAPALGYNVIAVGSFDDHGTGWQWSDDFMSLFSSYGGPPTSHNDRTKPEVVAVGNHSSTTYGLTSTTTTSPWIGPIGKGTSYSAPEVSGEASLLMNISPALMVHPDAVKAVIMASADHNIEGNSRLSSKDGAGGINVLEAYNIVNKGRGIRWNGTVLSYDSGRYWFGPSFNANAGQKVRAAIVWDANSAGYGGSDNLDVDLDLYIQRLSGTVWIDESRAGSSNSWDNNYEIVEFNVPISGTYRAMVSKYRWNNVSNGENFGYAIYVN